jgi:hypothetical protein
LEEYQRRLKGREEWFADLRSTDPSKYEYLLGAADIVLRREKERIMTLAKPLLGVSVIMKDARISNGGVPIPAEAEGIISPEASVMSRILFTEFTGNETEMVLLPIEVSFIDATTGVERRERVADNAKNFKLGPQDDELRTARFDTASASAQLSDDGRAAGYYAYEGFASLLSPAADAAADAGDLMEAAGETLPPGWRRQETRAGKVYYTNAATGETQYEPPAPSSPAGPVQAVAAAAADAGDDPGLGGSSDRAHRDCTDGEAATTRRDLIDGRYVRLGVGKLDPYDGKKVCLGDHELRDLSRMGLLEINPYTKEPFTLQQNEDIRQVIDEEGDGLFYGEVGSFSTVPAGTYSPPHGPPPSGGGSAGEFSYSDGPEIASRNITRI